MLVRIKPSAKFLRRWHCSAQLKRWYRYVKGTLPHNWKSAPWVTVEAGDLPDILRMLHRR